MLKIEKIANEVNIREERESEFKTSYIIEPLYRGYGHTIGNSIRRVLLSSIPGAAVKGMKIEGVLNEFSTIDGVKEAVTDIVLNVKEIVLKTEIPGEKKMTLSVKGPKVVTAADLELDSDLELINPEAKIATITTDRELEMEFLVDTGEGFVLSEELDTDDWEVGYIAIDAVYTPIKNINYKVEDKMVGRVTDFDKLTLFIETNGGVEIEDALSYAVELLEMHLDPFLNIGDKMEEMRKMLEEEEEEEVEEEEEETTENLKIEELDLTVRSYNCLKKAEIETIGKLAEYSIPELLQIKNLGRKSLTEIIEKMKEYGYELNNASLDE